MKKESERLYRLFSGLDRAYGMYKVAGPKNHKGKREGKAVTKAEPLTLDLWRKHLAGQIGLGVIPIRDDGNVLWGAIDVDDYELNLELLSKRLAVMELPLILCRTKSGGAHLYLFLSEPVQATFIRSILNSFAAELGHSGSEIFPKQNRLANDKDIGNWINMPYQFDAKETDRYAIYNGESLDLNTFLNLADEMKVSESDLKAYIHRESEDFVEGPPCLQILSRRGFPDGVRNNSLYNTGIYLKLRYGDDWEDKLDGYNQKYMKPPLAHKEVSQVLRNVRKVRAFYRCTQPPICDVCNKEVCRTKVYGVGTSENKEPGVIVDDIKQIRGFDYFLWIMQVQGERIEVTTDEMLSFRLFKRKCVEKLRILPNPMKNDAWERYIAERIKDCEVIEVPDDAGDKGVFLHHLEMFCTNQAASEDREGLLRGKPWVNEKRIYFRLPDLIKYLDQQRIKNINRTQIWTWLKDSMSAESHQFHIKGKCVRCWSITEFNTQTKEFNVPRVDVGEF
jgi:hypothetical protein